MLRRRRPTHNKEEPGKDDEVPHGEQKYLANGKHSLTAAIKLHICSN